MAQRGLGQAKLADIREGFRTLKASIKDKTDTANLRGLVRDLRRIPAGDRDKKRELAAFFQQPEASQYSREDRRRAYDDVLGRERNERQRG